MRCFRSDHTLQIRTAPPHRIAQGIEPAEGGGSSRPRPWFRLFGRVNAKVGLRITIIVGMLLPIIIVGQNIPATAADARSQATYNDAVVLEEAKQIQAHLEA
jgi:hypothetical protein